jgi:hypothetical protein
MKPPTWNDNWDLDGALKYRIRRWAFVIILAIAYLWAENVPL